MDPTKMEGDAPRYFSPWARFTPPDQESIEDLTQFEEAVTLVRTRRQEEEWSQLREKSAATTNSLRELAECGISEAAKAKIDELIESAEIPSPGRFVADFNLAKVETKELGIHLRELLLEMSNRALNGNPEAVSDLLGIARDTTFDATVLERLFPEIAEEIARKSSYWPVVLRGPQDTGLSLNTRLEKLKVGSDINRALYCQFRNLKGSDKNYAAREWAKCAVRTIEETIRRLLRARENDMFSVPTTKAFNLRLGPSPAWLESADLPPLPFSAVTVEMWVPIVRDMIRQDAPDFHEHADWSNVRRSMEASGRCTKGAIQNKILDRICHGLRQLAPEA